MRVKCKERAAPEVFPGLPLPVEGAEFGAGTEGLADEILGRAEFR